MRIERSVTSISWLPSEAVEGIIALPFNLGITSYDLPPPGRIVDLATIATMAVSASLINRAFVEIEDGETSPCSLEPSGGRGH
ncbi:MAG: hypothetical protein ACR2ME_10215 [Acidimicrobiia bacterium]